VTPTPRRVDAASGTDSAKQLDPARSPRGTRRRSGRIGGSLRKWAGVVAAAAAIVVPFTVLLIQLLPASPAVPRSASSTPAAPAVSTSTFAPVQTTVQQTNSACIDSGGRVLRCDIDQAGLIVTGSPCATESALRGLGIDTGLRQLSVVASPTLDGRCRLVPGEVAARAGATAEDIRRLASGETVSSISLCFATEEGPEIACSRPHAIEYVGPWQDYDGRSQAQTLCDGQARRYTNRTFDSPTEELKLTLLTLPGSYRCAVEAASPMDKTVWQIGGRPLR
jgi:hypothetical protein